MSAPEYTLLPGERELWRGRQWAVTTHGLQAIAGPEYLTFPDGKFEGYWIEAEQIADDLPDYSLPEHMATKGWVDIDDFNAAWRIGLARFKHKPISQETIEAACARAQGGEHG